MLTAVWPQKYYVKCYIIILKRVLGSRIDVRFMAMSVDPFRWLSK